MFFAWIGKLATASAYNYNQQSKCANLSAIPRMRNALHKPMNLDASTLSCLRHYRRFADSSYNSSFRNNDILGVQNVRRGRGKRVRK